jgi:hypothetical protein
MCEIKFHCPKCKQKIEAIEDWAGASSSCPKCGAELIIPSKSDEETIVETMQTAGRAYNPLKPTPTKDKHEINLNDEVLDETKFLLDYLESCRKSTCMTVAGLSILFCIVGIIILLAAEGGAKMGGVIMAIASGVLGCGLYKWVCMFYRLKRVYWLLMQGIYKNTKKA